jgi:hypothetical protein
MELALYSAEIKNKYPSEWVLIEDPEYNEEEELIGGKLLWHSLDHDALYEKAMELRPKKWAVFFTGDPPADVVLVL